jgi:hypothetical protein
MAERGVRGRFLVLDRGYAEEDGPRPEVDPRPTGRCSTWVVPQHLVDAVSGPTMGCVRPDLW